MTKCLQTWRRQGRVFIETGCDIAHICQHVTNLVAHFLKKKVKVKTVQFCHIYNEIYLSFSKYI